MEWNSALCDFEAGNRTLLSDKRKFKNTMIYYLFRKKPKFMFKEDGFLERRADDERDTNLGKKQFDGRRSGSVFGNRHE